MTVAFLLYILNERMKVSNSSSIKNKQLYIKKISYSADKSRRSIIFVLISPPWVYSKARPIKRRKIQRDTSFLRCWRHALISSKIHAARLAYLVESNEAKTSSASCGHSNYSHVQCFRQQPNCHGPLSKTRGTWI